MDGEAVGVGVVAHVGLLRRARHRPPAPSGHRPVARPRTPTLRLGPAARSCCARPADRFRLIPSARFALGKMSPCEGSLSSRRCTATNAAGPPPTPWPGSPCSSSPCPSSWRLRGWPACHPITGFYAFVAGTAALCPPGLEPADVGRRRLDHRAALRRGRLGFGPRGLGRTTSTWSTSWPSWSGVHRRCWSASCGSVGSPSSSRRPSSPASCPASP